MFSADGAAGSVSLWKLGFFFLKVSSMLYGSGYIIEGIPGAAMATLGIFLSSFLFVLILNPFVPGRRESVWTAAFLDAVNVAAVGIMAVVTVELGAGVLTSWVVAFASAIGALLFRLNAAWLVVGGAALGWMLSLVG